MIIYLPFSDKKSIAIYFPDLKKNIFTIENAVIEDFPTKLQLILQRSKDIAISLEGFSKHVIWLSLDSISEEIKFPKDFEELKKQINLECRAYIMNVVPLLRIVLSDLIEHFDTYSITLKAWKCNIYQVKRRANKSISSAVKCSNEHIKFIERINKNRDKIEEVIDTLEVKVEKPWYSLIWNCVPSKHDVWHSVKSSLTKNTDNISLNKSPDIQKTLECKPKAVLILSSIEEEFSKCLIQAKLICEFALEYYRKVHDLDDIPKNDFYIAMFNAKDGLVTAFRNILHTLTIVTTDLMSIQLEIVNEIRDQPNPSADNNPYGENHPRSLRVQQIPVNQNNICKSNHVTGDAIVEEYITQESL